MPFMIGINVLQRPFNMLHILKKGCLFNNISNNLWEIQKTRRNCFGISKAELWIIDWLILLILEGQCRAQLRLSFVLDTSNFVSSG